MEHELQKTFVDDIGHIISEQNKTSMIENFKEFTNFMMMYSCAIKEVRTKFEVLNDEMSVTNKRNPIQMIKSRIKKPDSIFGKLERRGFELSMTSVLENINDVAGVRIICAFINDIYDVADMFASQDDIRVIQVKDYIKNPKPNGYRSYHMIVEVPVFFSNRKQHMKVEVQLRTIAMDFWASLEHSMKYKKDIPDAESIMAQLKECAESIAATDEKMQKINDTINNND